MDGDLIVFQGRKIRRTFHNEEWWFSVEDVALALVDTVNVKDYINKMRRRDVALSEGYGQRASALDDRTSKGAA
ncbi:MAG: phage antirepressor protein [Chitinispirillia bacterium]|nr:phage antirepressor protein [Chitinispirillia bacterium]